MFCIEMLFQIDRRSKKKPGGWWALNASQRPNIDAAPQLYLDLGSPMVNDHRYVLDWTGG